MKKVLSLAIFLFLAAGTVMSQSNKEEVEFYQSLFGMEKKAVVSEFIQLEGESSTEFWNLYDAYEAERKANGQKRIDLLHKYAESYLELDPATTDALVAESIKINDEQFKLIKKYYKSIKKVAGSKAAAQFYQLENYFRNALGVVLMEQIPFVGEFDF